MLTPDSTLGSARPPLGERELVFRISRKTIVFGFVLGLVLGAPGIVLLFVVTRRLIDDWSKDVSGSVLFFAVSLFFLWAGKAVWKKTNRLRHIEVAVHADGLSFYDGRTRISCLWDQVEEVRWKQSKHYDEGSLSYISHQVTVRRKHGPPLVFDEALQNIASLARALEKKCGRAKFFDESSGSRVDLDIASAPLLALQEGCFKNENLHASSPSVAPVGIGQLIGEFSDYRVGPFRVLGWASSLVGITLVVLGFLILGAEACAFGMILAGLGAVFLALAFLRNKKRFLVYTEVLSWKYFDGPSGPAEVSACSLIARSAARIIGHIGICPRQFIVLGDGRPPVSTIHAIDWLGSAAHAGSGALLMLRAFTTSQTQYAIDGSAQAQALFPRLGFEQKPTLAIFHKVLAPFHRLRTTGQGLFRKWAGTAKDVVSVWRARTPPVPRTVELRPAPAFTEEMDCLLRQSSQRMVTCRRDHLLLNYFLRYPLPGFSGWTIHASQRMIGAALLKITPHGRIQPGKIVDCWLDTEDPSCWQAAVAALLDRLRALSADSVTCFAATPSLHAGLLLNGFTKAGERNVYLRDKQQLLPRDLPFGLSMLEGDHAIL